MADWSIEPGTITTRAAVAAQYGGSTQGGIQPSSQSPNIMIYSDPSSARVHGYTYDGFADDGAYYYTGEGQVGDQEIVRGNRALLHHRENQRTLRVFEAAGTPAGPGGKPQRYLGAFAVDPIEPYRFETTPDRTGNERRVVVFRLIPTDAVVAAPGNATAESISGPTIVELIAPENNVRDTFEVVATETREGRRWEAALMAQLNEYLTSQGHTVRRIAIQPEGETTRMLTDTYDATERELFEIKPTASRAHVRAAVAQLLDYRRHVADLDRATVLLPAMPSADLRAYIASTGLGLAIFRLGDLTRSSARRTCDATRTRTAADLAELGSLMSRRR